MKQYEQPAKEIVAQIVEDLNDDTFDDVSEPKDIYADDPDFWTQFDGDFGNPWVWGGSWYNEAKNKIVHFEGLDNMDESEQDIEPDDVEVPEGVIARAKAKVHDPYLDTDEAKEDPEWHRRMVFAEEMEAEQIIEKYKLSRSEFLNARKSRTFWTIDVADAEYLIAEYEDKVLAQFDEETAKRYKETWPPQAKIMEIVTHFVGLNNLASSFKMTYQEARQLLGAHNI
jgi:hypothetical protein